MWYCDMKKRKKIREQALQQSLVMDEEEDEDVEINEDKARETEEDVPIIKTINNEDVELEEAW